MEFKQALAQKLIEDLSIETLTMLRLLADLQKISLSEALRRSISTESFIQCEIRNGNEILVKRGDTLQKLVFS